jgi:hypothetical protein
MALIQILALGVDLLTRLTFLILLLLPGLTLHSQSPAQTHPLIKLVL